MPMGGREVSAATAAAMNDEMSKASAAAPSRIKYFASLPWEYEEAAIAELHRARASGAVGVMVLANINRVPLTDERFAGIWAEIDELALPVLVHPTTPPGAGRDVDGRLPPGVEHRVHLRHVARPGEDDSVPAYNTLR
jgi:aminocarboxymuconate-semialdehyde decarboxylase